MIVVSLACMAVAFYFWYRLRICQDQLRRARQELEDRANQEWWRYALTSQPWKRYNGHRRDTSDYPTLPDRSQP